MALNNAILPGATLGMMGGGQLGRMFAHAATAMGYRVVVLDPNADSPAGDVAHLHLCASYDDKHALDTMAQQCAVVTTEFENVPAEALSYLENKCCVRPGARAVEIAQNRIREKQYVQSLDIEVVPFRSVQTERDVRLAFDELAVPLIVKTARLGYDGKGQVSVRTFEEGLDAWLGLDSVECVFEHQIDLFAEISVLLARSSTGETSCFPVVQNVHEDGILFTSTVPASVDEKLQRLAASQVRKIADDLAYCGMLAVEFFIDRNGNLFFNEMAPRTHNSGHFTIDACHTSQFEQQVRAICGLPLGSPEVHSAVTMVNLLGDLWQNRTPDWLEIMRDQNTKFHLYGKKEARPKRKMGHFCSLAPIGEKTYNRARQLYSTLSANCMS